MKNKACKCFNGKCSFTGSDAKRPCKYGCDYFTNTSQKNTPKEVPSEVSSIKKADNGKAKHTKGKWVAEKLLGCKEIKSDALDTYGNKSLVCTTAGREEKEDIANANLITEAGTIANETGLTPRQLAEQRSELLEALKEMVNREAIKFNFDFKRCNCNQFLDTGSCRHVSALKAIAKAEGK
jgi:hypothetical protein